MPCRLSQGAMLWESLPWEAVLRLSSSAQRLPITIAQTSHRAFSSTRPRRKATELKEEYQEFHRWMKEQGKAFERPLPDSTNYLSAYGPTGGLIRNTQKERLKALAPEDEAGISDEERAKRLEARRMNTSGITDLPREREEDLRPFPLNSYFKSERVLSEELRNLVFEKVQQLNGDITAVSAAFGIDMHRVAAVVRLKTIEEQWKKEGKPLAKPYNDAVLAMLPQTLAPRPDAPRVLHEDINDLPVHAATRTQIFYPASESRQFTREDAAKAFSQKLLPADKRIPHPELIDIEKWALEGLGDEERADLIRKSHNKAQKERSDADYKRKAAEEKTTRVVPGKRWDFRFRDVSVESVGPQGRSTSGVGIRYGMPHDDRKRGKYKLPTSVE